MGALTQPYSPKVDADWAKHAKQQVVRQSASAPHVACTCADAPFRNPQQTLAIVGTNATAQKVRMQLGADSRLLGDP